MEEFFESLLAEPEAGAESSHRAIERAALFASLRGSYGTCDASGDLRATKLAAYLSGALDAAEGEKLAAELLHAPDEIYELEAAQAFLDRIAVQESVAPPDLMAAVLADAARDVPRPVDTARRSWTLSRWGSQWDLAGGAVAAVLLAVGAIWVSEVTIVTSQETGAAGPKLASSDSRVSEAALPQPAANPRNPAAVTPEAVYTAPNPPQAITSHAVTVDDYPADSIRLAEQGTVKLKYYIQTDGNVGDCQLIESSGFPRLDDAGCVIVRKWQFKPASLLDGSPVAVWMTAAIAFQLNAGNGGVSSPAERR